MSFSAKFYKSGLLKLLFLFAFIGILLTGWEQPALGQEDSLTGSMILIPAGTFKRGCDRFGPQHGAPEQSIHLDDFGSINLRLPMNNLKKSSLNILCAEVFFQIATTARFQNSTGMKPPTTVT